MDIKAYIASGTLEAYVLGALSPAEVEQVQVDIALYPELARHLEELEDTLFRMASKELIQPPAGLNDKIWSAISAGNATHMHVKDPVPELPKTLPLGPVASPFSRMRYAAIWVALLGSVAVNVILWNQNNQQHTQNLAMNASLDSMRQEQQQLVSLADNYNKGRDMMADTSMSTIVMHTMLKGHPMAATLYWSKSSSEAYVMLNALPQPPKGMQYQLWAIHDGKPMDMGVLPNEVAGTPVITKVGRQVAFGEAFAISLEREGGSPTPTAENIYVLGKAS